MNRTEKLLNKLDNQLRISRYKYSGLEKLRRLEQLSVYYAKNQVPTKELLIGTLEVTEKLTKNLVLPLKVRGMFLKEGRPMSKFYIVEELIASTKNPANQKFPIMLDHRNQHASTVIGIINKVTYAKVNKSVRFFGHINDETHARNVIDKAITEVSVTVNSLSDFDEEHGLIGRNLTFEELSLVMDGSVRGNFIEEDK